MPSSIPAALTLTLALLLCAACSRPPPAPAQNHSQPPSFTDPTSVRAQLAAHRAQQIDRLDAYAKAASFPHNYTTPTAAHIFRDEAGRLCAVANLVHQDGRDDLVEATVREHNDLAIADVNDGPMLDWVVGSGLTQEELVKVQMPAPPLARRPMPVPRPDHPDLIAKRGAEDELHMNAAVVQHIEEVERELRANAEASLDVATARLIAQRAMIRKGPTAVASN